MERKIIFTPEEYYHVFNRGVEKRSIFIDPADSERFQKCLYLCNSKRSVVIREIQGEPYVFERGETVVDILGYALMPNHFHLILHEKENGGISKFMLKLLTGYSMYFNTKYKRSGPLFCKPFRAKHIDDDDYFRWVFSYVHLNPLELFDKDWEKRSSLDVQRAKEFMHQYSRSSYLEYFGHSRQESKIINKNQLPISLDQVESIEAMIEKLSTTPDKH